MDNENVPIGSIQSVLGHENRTTTEIYLSRIGEPEKEAIAVLERASQNSQTDPQCLKWVSFKSLIRRILADQREPQIAG